MNQFQQLTYLLKGSVSHKVYRTVTAIFFISSVLLLAGCEREPNLYLHQGGKETTMDLPKIDLELKVLWDYEFKYDVVYTGRRNGNTDGTMMTTNSSEKSDIPNHLFSR